MQSGCVLNYEGAPLRLVGRPHRGPNKPMSMLSDHETPSLKPNQHTMLPTFDRCKIVNLCKKLSQTASVRVIQPPRGGVGHDAALPLVLVAPGRGQSVPICASFVPPWPWPWWLFPRHPDVPSHVTFASSRGLFIPCQNLYVYIPNWGHHFFRGAVRWFLVFPSKKKPIFVFWGHPAVCARQ